MSHSLRNRREPSSVSSRVSDASPKSGSRPPPLDLGPRARSDSETSVQRARGSKSWRDVVKPALSDSEPLKSSKSSTSSTKTSEKKESEDTSMEKGSAWSKMLSNMSSGRYMTVYLGMVVALLCVLLLLQYLKHRHDKNKTNESKLTVEQAKKETEDWKQRFEQLKQIALKQDQVINTLQLRVQQTEAAQAQAQAAQNAQSELRSTSPIGSSVPASSPVFGREQAAELLMFSMVDHPMMRPQMPVPISRTVVEEVDEDEEADEAALEDEVSRLLADVSNEDGSAETDEEAAEEEKETVAVAAAIVEVQAVRISTPVPPVVPAPVQKAVIEEVVSDDESADETKTEAVPVTSKEVDEKVEEPIKPTFVLPTPPAAIPAPVVLKPELDSSVVVEPKPAPAKRGPGRPRKNAPKGA